MTVIEESNPAEGPTRNFVLVCSKCGKPVSQPYGNPDDVGTQFYHCVFCRQPVSAIKKEISWENAFALKFAKAAKENPEAFKIKSEKLREPSYPDYECFCEHNSHGDPVDFKPAKVGAWLAENLHFKTDRKTGILFYGDDSTGKWSQDGETKVAEICAQILGEENRASHYVNILHHLKGLTYCDVEFSRNIAVENGILNPETSEFKPPTLDEMTVYSVATTYEPTADCPSWKEFLKQVVAPEDIPTLQEWSGYLLLPDYRFHKLLWVHGEGRNGKGVWQRTMEGILGEDMVSGVGLEEFDGNHRFALRQLFGRLFNPCSEPTTNHILQTALLKKATGQDTISAECKGTDKRIDFRNTAKITVLANRFPKVKDSTVAFTERRLFIKFPNEFSGKNQIQNIEKNWLDDPVERMGILNWMLQGLQRLLLNGVFTESKSQEETEILFQRASDSISAYIKEMAILGRNYVTLRSFAYEGYKIYADTFGLDIETDRKFTERLKDTKGITQGKSRGERAWKGVTFKEISEDGEILDLTRTGGTGGTRPTHYTRFENLNLEESGGCVPRVPCVPDTTAKDNSGGDKK